MRAKQIKVVVEGAFAKGKGHLAELILRLGDLRPRRRIGRRGAAFVRAERVGAVSEDGWTPDLAKAGGLQGAW